MSVLRFLIRKWFQRVCACGHSPVAHENYSQDTGCCVCECAEWRPKLWRLK